jgi:hypothetical protein
LSTVQGRDAGFNGSPALVTLPDGRTFSVPATAADWSPTTSKKRKMASVKKACDVLAKGTFVLDDELMAGGKVHSEVRRVTLDSMLGVVCMHSSVRAVSYSPPRSLLGGIVVFPLEKELGGANQHLAELCSGAPRPIPLEVSANSGPVAWVTTKPA